MPVNSLRVFRKALALASRCCCLYFPTTLGVLRIQRGTLTFIAGSGIGAVDIFNPTV